MTNYTKKNHTESYKCKITQNCDDFWPWCEHFGISRNLMLQLEIVFFVYFLVRSNNVCDLTNFKLVFMMIYIAKSAFYSFSDSYEMA